MRIAQVMCFAFVVGCGDCNPTRGASDDTVDGANDCTPNGAHRCVGATYQTCVNGTWEVAVDCPQACLDTLGCVICNPGQTFCKDGNVWQCDNSGNPQNEVAVCTGVNVCVGGACVDACADAAANKSYIGCEYWAVDLDNAIEVWGTLSQATCTSMYQGQVKSMPVCYKTQGPFVLTAGLCDPPATMGGTPACPSGYTCGAQSVCVSDAQHSPFAIVVSNPHVKDATVTLTGPGGQTVTRVIAAGQTVPIFPQMNGIGDQSVDGSTLEKRAYKLVSDLPIVAYQFNPLDNVNVFSNDGSLLIPGTTFDADYYVMSYPTLNRRPNTNSYYGYLTIVASKDGTQVSVTPTVAVVAGPNTQPITANATATFTLNAFDVLQLQAAGSGDLTGTHITSPNMSTFGVFGGHEATAFGETTAPDNQHTAGPYAADHLEEMLFPSTTWGMSFAITRSKLRTNEPDVLRIMAQKAGTTVAFMPPPAAGTCGTLNPGQFCEVKIQGDTELVSNEPILVGHYLESTIWCSNTSCIGTGDPSMALAVPTEQFRKEYTILVPSQYEENYISIAAAATGGVLLDNVPVMLAPYPGGGTHRAARVGVPAGQHKITCADGCGITIYGWSYSVSYMFAGGLDLKPIVIL